MNVHFSRALMLAALLSAVSCGTPQNTSSSVNSNQDTFVSEQEINDYDFRGLINQAQSSTVSFGVAEFGAASRVFQCMNNASISEKAGFVLNGMRGMVVDGAGGDISLITDGAYYAGKETVRLAMSTSMLGRWILRSRGSRTSEQVAAQAAVKTWEFSGTVSNFVRQHGKDMATYTYRLGTDKAYASGQAIKIFNVILLSMIPLLDAVKEASCTAVRSEVARVMGMVSYEVALTVGFAIITAEAAGSGALIKLGSVVGKLGRFLSKAGSSSAKFIRQVIDGLKDFAKRLIALTKRSRYADEVAETASDSSRIVDAIGDGARFGRYIDEGTLLVNCTYQALSLALLNGACKLSFATNAAEKSITKHAKKNHFVRNWWNRVKKILEEGKKAPYEHTLTGRGELGGKLAASVDNGSKGKGGLRLIFERVDGEVIIHGMTDYH